MGILKNAFKTLRSRYANTRRRDRELLIDFRWRELCPDNPRGFLKIHDNTGNLNPRFVAIFICRERGAYVAGDAAEELITLAHELGHWRSWVNCERTEQYDEVLQTPRDQWKNLLPEGKHEILGEEMRAWKHARTFLEEVEFRDWQAFGRQRTEGLGEYCGHLGLPTSEIKD